MRPRFQRPVRWLLLLALTAPLAVGVTGIGDRQAGATSGSPAAVAVNFALRQLGKPYRWGGNGPRSMTSRRRLGRCYAPRLRDLGADPDQGRPPAGPAGRTARRPPPGVAEQVAAELRAVGLEPAPPWPPLTTQGWPP